MGQASESVLYSFGSNSTDGTYPIGGLLFDSAGNLYGTTTGGGQYCHSSGYYGCGTVYKLSPSATGWNETVLYNFCTTGNENSCPDGAQPQDGLIFDAVGNLYGTTESGGATGFGTVFELSPPSLPGAQWTETVLWTFGGQKKGDGAYPSDGKLNWDKHGNLYGTTIVGGKENLGTVFELSASSGEWNESVLHSFDGADGNFPWFGVAIDQSGNLYGTTNIGGIVNTYSVCASGCGLVYQLKPSNHGWTETVLYKFDGNDGARPYSPISIDQSGNLYGTFEYGGNSVGCEYGCGGVFKLSPNGTGGLTKYSFDFDGQNGSNPESGVLVDNASGALFGTTGGEVYLIQGKKETVLYQFCSQPYCTDGESPQGGTLISRGNALYGVTVDGGANQEGVVFSISK
jgi:uncharacterized repeat protein (TIGR03803 family)